MKKLILTLFAGAAILTTACAENKTVTTNVTVLPAQAQNFLKKHFSTLSVQQIQVESKMIGREYEVNLNGGCEIDFDKKGEWTKIDCQNTAVPASVIPEKIAKYVTNNHKGLFIVSIDKDNGGYDVDLSDDTDLKFNGKGDFLRIDY